MTLLTQCYYYELLSPSFFSFLSFQISATTLTNASPITTIVSFFIVFPPFSLGFHSGNRPKEISIGFLLYNTHCNTYWMFCQCLFLFFSKKFPCMIYAWNHMLLPSRAVTSFLRHDDTLLREFWQVSMPSRAYASFLRTGITLIRLSRRKSCQCPLGLMPHFYWAGKFFPTFETRCQCPHGLIPHFYYGDIVDIPFAQVCVNALSG